jgi:hypothetical protein
MQLKEVRTRVRNSANFGGVQHGMHQASKEFMTQFWRSADIKGG